MENGKAAVFLDKLTDMVDFLIPNYILEGKNSWSSPSDARAAGTVR